MYWNELNFNEQSVYWQIIFVFTNVESQYYKHLWFDSYQAIPIIHIMKSQNSSNSEVTIATN